MDKTSETQRTCYYAGCGKPLRPVIGPFHLCDDGHIYGIHRRGFGDDWWPAGGHEERMVIEIDALRAMIEKYLKRHDNPCVDVRFVEGDLDGEARALLARLGGGGEPKGGVS